MSDKDKSFDDVVRFKFIWHAQPGACLKCASLDGRIYEQSIFDSFIMDAQYGPVWSLDGDYSLAHGGTPHNCRCGLEIQYEVDEEGLMEYLGVRNSEVLR